MFITNGIQPPISVIINGVPQAFEIPPVIIDGRTMLPLRAVGEALGMTVSFHSATRTATLTTAEGTIITHVIYSSEVTVDGTVQTFDVPSVTTDGRTLLPLRMLANAIGADIIWDGTARTVTISH
jgi:hypothetical protein